jgi:hypothetical protein
VLGKGRIGRGRAGEGGGGWGEEEGREGLVSGADDVDEGRGEVGDIMRGGEGGGHRGVKGGVEEEQRELVDEVAVGGEGE